MMEDPFIENNNGVSDMSADDGGSSDLDETEDEESVGSDAFITPLAQYKPHDDHLGLRRRRRTNNLTSITQLTGLEGLRLTQCKMLKSTESLSLMRLKSLKNFNIDKNKFKNGSKTEEVFTFISSDLHLTKKEEPQLLEKPNYYHGFRHFHLTLPLTKIPSMKFDLISKFLNYVSLGGPMIDQIYQSTLKLMIPVSLLLNKPFDDHFRLRQRRIKLSFRGGTLDLTSWFRDDDYLLHRLIDLARGVDVVSQMISPPTVIAAPGTYCNPTLATASVVTARPRHTEQRITPSSPLLMNTPHRIDMPGGNSNDEELHGRSKGWSQKMDFEWIFVITNIVLESMSAIFTQLSSKQKPQYALFGMLLSYLALLTCIIELIYEDRHHQQIPIWRRRRGTWSYYQPQRRKSFATSNNIVALACALGQCVVTTINYRFESLIKLTVSPIILANGVLFSKILKYRQREAL